MNPATSWAASLARIDKRDWLDPILDQLPVGFLIAEAPSGRILEANRQLERILRRPVRAAADVAEYGAWVGYHPDGRPYAPEEWPVARALAGAVTTGEEIAIDRGDGSEGFISVDAAPIHSEEGRLIAALAVVQDITERKQAERSARQAARRLNDVLESTTDCVFVLDRDWRFLFMNGRAVREIADGRDLIGRNVWEEFPHAADGIFRDKYRHAMEAREAVTFEAYYPPPLASWYEINACPSEDGIAVFFRNIDAEKAAQAAILKREAEAREKGAILQATLENMDQGLMVMDADRHVALYNRRALELLGLPDAFLATHPHIEAVKDYQERMGDFSSGEAAALQLTTSKGFLSEPRTYERVRSNGTVLEVRTVPLADGSAVRTYTDITARRRAEAAIRESEARYRLLADNATDMIVRLNLAGVRTYMSPASHDVLGYEPHELVGTPLGDLVHPDDREALSAALGELRSGHVERQTFTYRHRHKSGRWLWLEARRRLVRDEHGKAVEFVSVVRDISERVQLEEQLRQAQKMEAMGQLTGGVAHEFNNLLMIVMGNAELLVEEIADPGLKSLAAMVQAAAERGSELTEKLLAFGRRQSLRPERIDVNAVVEGMTPLLRRTLGETIVLEIALRAGLDLAVTDRSLLESAILNLAVNARDAMPDGGTLGIRTGARQAGPGEGPLPIGQAVVFVTVADTGTGIAPDVLARVFEPFFTTKDIGQGSGLGLSMVYGFVRQAGGHVSIESREGEGTRVTLVLPAIAATPAHAGEDPSGDTSSPDRRRILVVEDEPQVLQLVSLQLESLGYDVTAVTSGRDALEVVSNGRAFDLLFTDIVLPQGISGVEVARQTKAALPELKVLLTSGYPEEVFERHGRFEGDATLLRKPYRRKELADTLKRLLTA